MKTISKDLSLRLPNSCFLSAVDKRASILIGCFPLSDMFGVGVVEGMDFGVNEIWVQIPFPSRVGH